MTSIQWQSVADAAEGSFSVDLPLGWSHEVAMLRIGTEQRRVVRTVSPDGSVTLFGHDPELPTFFEPSAGMFVQPPLQQVSPYVTAEAFLSDYLRQRFSQAPGFRLDGLRPEQELADTAMARGAAMGFQSRVTTVSARFGLTDQGRQLEALLIGSTTSFGAMWLPDVAGVFCAGDVEQYRDVLLRVAQSEQTNPQWRAAQNQQFATTMAFDRQQDQLRMNQLQDLHQQRMGDIAATGAANTQIHQDRMESAAAGHAAFLDRLNQPTTLDPAQAPGLDAQHAWINTVREEETVRSASGEDVQVAAAADRYLVNEQDRSWVGVSETADANDLRAAGIDPDDFQEVQVRR